MMRDEAIGIIATIMAAWPMAKAMSDETAELWLTDLAPLDTQTALAALNRLRFQLDYPPSSHQFAEAYRALTPAPAHVAQLPPGERIRQRDLATTKAMRFALSKVGKGRHWHHEKNPAIHCPTCSLHDHDIDDPNSPYGCKHRADCKRCAELGLEARKAIG